jgi:Fe2+ or Zn2+ uptake regulation protein
MNRPSAAVQLCHQIPLSDHVRRILHNAGLRPTPRRVALASLLLTAPSRRVTAEILYDEARSARCPVSRATVCYTLRNFEHAGLLRRIPVRKSKKSWFAAEHRIIASLA